MCSILTDTLTLKGNNPPCAHRLPKYDIWALIERSFSPPEFIIDGTDVQRKMATVCNYENFRNIKCTNCFRVRHKHPTTCMPSIMHLHDEIHPQ
jgi:hypothetical protein